MIDEIKKALLDDDASPRRDPDASCDHCGASRGSMTIIEDTALCTACYNDLDIWEEEDLL